MATLFKRNLHKGWTWVLQWRENGRIKTRHLGLIPKTAAEQVKKRLETELALKKHGIFPEYKPITLKDFSKEYVQSIQIDHSHNTVKRFMLAMNSFIDILGNQTLDSISIRDIEEWRRKRNVSPTSINIEFRHLKAAFQKAVSWGYIDKNPFKEVKQLKTPKKIPQVIPLEDIRAFFSTIDDPKDLAFFLTLYFIGSRPSETFLLKWEQIDFDKNIIIFTAPETKGKKDRMIYLHPKIKQLLLDLPKTSDRPFDQFKREYEPTKRMKKYLKKANLNLHYSPKWLRHTFTTTAISTTKDTMGTKEILGHSSISVTEIYTHYSVEAQKQIIEKIPDPTDF